ncbi:MAG TPA: hypothetical protein VFZ65_14300 [Planctomycetota bacterium]|nr:hypothetical protein [Planctomycetota bacterium]
MQTTITEPVTKNRYAQCVEASRRVRWDIDKDVLRGRTFDFTQKFLPDGLTRVRELTFLDANEQRLVSQIQGRTYANLFGLCERFIAAKTIEVSRRHCFGDQQALEAMVRFTDEELKHQELFRRLEDLMADGMPAGYTFVPESNAVAHEVLGRSTWSVLALICHIEMFVLAHYRESIEPDTNLSPLWKDVFLHHWREESQHAILDELEWLQEDARLTPLERDHAVNDLIALVAAVDGVLQLQSKADADCLLAMSGRSFTDEQVAAIRASFLAAYRWQYIAYGLEGRFTEVLSSVITPAQLGRVQAALAPIVG